MTNTEKTRSDLRLAARALGELLAEVGDFYDVAEELAIGYANVMMQADTKPERRAMLQLGALNELQSVAANVMEWRVDDARELDVPWSEIGDCLEITRQAAQQKYGKPRD
jgi:hypothetical protein